MEDARLPLGEQLEGVVESLAAWTGREGAVPAPPAGDVRSALFAVSERRRFTGNVGGDSVEGTSVEAEAGGGGGHYAWVVKDLKLLPAAARDDVTAHRARRGAAAVRLQALESVRVALALPEDMAGLASIVATAVELLNSKDSLGDHDAAVDAKRKRKEAKLAKEAAAGEAGGAAHGGGDGAGPSVAEGADLTQEGGAHAAQAVNATPGPGTQATEGGGAAAAAKKPVLSAEEKAAKAAEKAAAAADKATKAAEKAAAAAKKAEVEAKEAAKKEKQANMMRSLFGAPPKPRAAAAPSLEAAGPSSAQANPAAGAAPVAPVGAEAAAARRDEGTSLAAVSAAPPCPGAVVLAMPCAEALAAMDARLLSGVGQAIDAHVTTWRISGGGRPPLRCLSRWGTRLSVKHGSQYDPLRAGHAGGFQAGVLGLAGVMEVMPTGEAKVPAKRKLLQVDTCEQRVGLGPSTMMKPSTGPEAPTAMEPLPRPAYYGTWPADRPPRAQGLVTLAQGRKPLAVVAEVEYDVDSAEEWEEEEPGESVDQEEDEDAGGDTASEADDGDGFVVEDGYLSADELGEDDKALLEATCAAATVGAPPAEVEATRLRSEVEHRAKRARDANRPLIITSLSRDVTTTTGAAAAQQPAGASTPPLAVPPNANVHLLNGFAIQLCDSRLVIGRPITAADRSAFGGAGGPGAHGGAGPSGAAGGGTQAGGEGGGMASGGGASGKGRPVKLFPEDLTPDLVRLMLASPGIMINKLTDAFVAGAGAARATKKATKECVGTLGTYEKSRWELNAHALALIGMTKQQADATRPPPPPKQPRAPKPPAAGAAGEAATGTLRATFGAAAAAADAAPQAAPAAEHTAVEQGGDEAEAMQE
jgi:hypothetical protein